MKFTRFIAAITVTLACSSAAYAVETLVFWSSGYPQQVQQVLQSKVFPAFEERYGVKIEYKDIGWGGPRDEQLVTGFAGGVGPDVYVNGTELWAVELDEFVGKWDEASAIHPAFWEISRWMSRGRLLYVPQTLEVRGYAYNKRLFMEAGLGVNPPAGWDEMLEYVRKLTKLDEAGSRVTQSGFETTWNAPFVANEYDWFIQQAGSSLHTIDLTTSLINTPTGVEALDYMLELYNIAHPPGYQPVATNQFARGAIAITRGLVSAKQQMEQAAPEEVQFFGLFAPRRDADSRPVALTLVNGLSISRSAKDPDLAWKFIQYMMSAEVQRDFAEVGQMMVAHNEVAADTSLDIVAWLQPWYEISPYAAPVGQFGTRRPQVANILVSALAGRISPGEAIIRMAEEHQLGLDEVFGAQ